MLRNPRKKYTNFIIFIIIVALALFVLLCPRKQGMTNPRIINYPATFQQSPVVINYPEYELQSLNSVQEDAKTAYMTQLNAEYDTRGDTNDFINVNQMPQSNQLFVYP